MSVDVIAAQTELRDLRRKARDARRQFARSSLGAFARAMLSAFGEYEQARREGVSRDDACRGLEAVLRDAWPHKPSKFAPACPDCDDTGWRERTCWDRQQCGRELCARYPERQHTYVEPCSCSAGDRMKRKRFTPEDELTKVGKTQKKRSGFSRMGQ